MMDQAGEEVIGQEFNVFGEEAKQKTNQEVGDLRAGIAVLAQTVGELGKFSGDFLGNTGAGFGRAELLGVIEDGPQLGQALWGEQIIQGQRRHLLDGVSEVGVNDDALDVGNDEQRRVLERFPVEQELVIGFVQVLVFALVLPGEEALFPNIGPALTAPLLVGSRFESEVLAGRIIFGGCGMADQATEIEEMLLSGGLLTQISVAPFGDEVLGGERWHCAVFPR